MKTYKIVATINIETTIKAKNIDEAYNLSQNKDLTIWENKNREYEDSSYSTNNIKEI